LDQLSEEEVRAYILNLRERGAARGTFKADYYGIQYLYRYTVSPVCRSGYSSRDEPKTPEQPASAASDP
jgi:hypothetical protein